MILVKSVRIRNFRSIVDATIELEDFNCFVGKNDCGKSNVLKALNLFFNNKTDYNTPFSFLKDYSKYAKKGAHQAKEIIITVEVNVPDSYKENGIKLWTKVWRADGLHSDNIKELFTNRTKAVTFLSRITYLYIPAVKSNEYFKYLLSQVYDSMTNTDYSTLRELNANYSRKLQELTTELSKDIKYILNIDSSLQMPENLNVLFRDLTFTTNDKFIKEIDLNQRGDGIKGRHIPAILRYIQKSVEKNRAKKAIVSSYIWGYEEPENGIEFLSCFEMAEELFSYRNDVQLLITTHSPAFYSVSTEKVGRCNYVHKSEMGYTKFNTSLGKYEIDNEIGLMPLVANYINKEHERYVEEKKTFEKKISELEKTIKEVKGEVLLLTEGKTDTKLIKKAFEELKLEDKLIPKISYYDFSEGDILGDGLSKLLERLKNINNNRVVIGLFDRDKMINNENKRFSCIGNGVYKANIPPLSNSERKLEDKISIEHYFTDEELTRELGEKGHLYMGKDFSEYGLSFDNNFCFQNREKNNNLTDITIIDRNNRHIQRLSDKSAMASKDDFAEYVTKNPNEFDFSNFIKIFDLIKEIVTIHCGKNWQVL